MEVYRLSRARYSDYLSGKGAAIQGARWNSVGVEMIYTAANRSLAMAEVAVHLTLATLPTDFIMLTIHIPDDIPSKKIVASYLPYHWNAFPPTRETRSTGDEFIAENEFCVLQVPSAVTQGDFNLLINPNHPDFKRIQVVDRVSFPFDGRIFK